MAHTLGVGWLKLVYVFFFLLAADTKDSRGPAPCLGHCLLYLQMQSPV